MMKSSNVLKKICRLRSLLVKKQKRLAVPTVFVFYVRSIMAMGFCGFVSLTLSAIKKKTPALGVSDTLVCYRITKKLFDRFVHV